MKDELPIENARYLLLSGAIVVALTASSCGRATTAPEIPDDWQTYVSPSGFVIQLPPGYSAGVIVQNEDSIGKENDVEQSPEDIFFFVFTYPLINSRRDRSKGVFQLVP